MPITRLYRLVPLLPRSILESSLFGSGRDYYWPNGVRHFEGVKQPYLDTALGIGFVYNDEVHAISGAGITMHGSLRIKQIHGVIAVVEHDHQKRKRSGLHSGVMWRHTLARAWHELALAGSLDLVEIQGAMNNRYIEDQGFDRLRKSYDDVARDLGYQLNPSTGNWELWLTNL